MKDLRGFELNVISQFNHFSLRLPTNEWEITGCYVTTELYKESPNLATVTIFSTFFFLKQRLQLKGKTKQKNK